MTLPGAMLVGISTPHKKSGLLFERYKKAFGAEYGACRNLDVEAFVDPEVVAACVMAGVRAGTPYSMRGWRARTPER
jgi:hypothetical protein